MKEDKIFDLDRGVVNALSFFSKNRNAKFPKFDLKRPLVVGSGNAKIVGQVLFKDYDAIFADESNFDEVLSKNTKFDSCVIISASGGKHAPIKAKKAKDKGLQVLLLTNNKDAIAKEYADKTILFPKVREPYTYNISTYLGMILSSTGEDSKKILKFIKGNYKKIPKNLKKYDSYFIIVPDKFEAISGMILTKFDELFGPKITARVLTFEHAKHAETIVSSKKELFVGLGIDNKTFGKNRLNLKLPKDCGYASFIACAYYLIGQIQKQNPPYFKKNIEDYVRKASELFEQKINVWVD